MRLIEWGECPVQMPPQTAFKRIHSHHWVCNCTWPDKCSLLQRGCVGLATSSHNHVQLSDEEEGVARGKGGSLILFRRIWIHPLSFSSFDRIWTNTPINNTPIVRPSDDDVDQLSRDESVRLTEITSNRSRGLFLTDLQILLMKSFSIRIYRSNCNQCH